MFFSKVAVIAGIAILAGSGFLTGKEVFQLESFKNGTLAASLFPAGSFKAGTLVEEIPLRTDGAAEGKSTGGLQNGTAAAQGRTAGNTKTQKTAVAANPAAKTAVKQKKQTTATEIEEPESPTVAAQPPAPTQPVQKEPVFCSETAVEPTHDPVIINEIAWMGDTTSVQHEWIELKNISLAVIPIGNWQLFDKSRMIKIVIQKDTVLSAGDILVLARQGKDKNWMEGANLSFSGTINNSNEELTLFDTGCRLIDKVSTVTAWPAGDNETKKTMERGADLTWHTSEITDGTPRAGNSIPQPETIEEPEISYTPPASGNASPPPPPPSVPPAQDATTTSPSENPQQPARVLISEVVAGIEGNADFDFVELYNTGDLPADLTGWTIKKRSSSGSESSLVAASRLEGKSIQPKKFFLLSNETGYTGGTAPDVPWPHSYSLAYTNNAVVVYNASGEKIDEVSWTEIPKGQSLTRQGWDSNTFAISETPTPQNSQSQ